MNRSIHLVLFDLGGVLVDWRGTRELLELVPWSEEEVRRFWFESPSVRAFERGRCSPLEFGRGVVEELGLEMEVPEFIDRFRSWDQGPFEGTAQLLGDLSRRHDLGCLSNNNQMHWPKLRDHYGLERFFKYRFLSYEIGLIKPQLELFRYVVGKIPYPASEVLFIDDNPECIEGARQAGFQARPASGLEAVRELLREEGLLPAG